jgi:hypothetical protein
MTEVSGIVEVVSTRVPWNKGKIVGAKPPLRPKHDWSIRTKLQVEGRVRDLALFNLATIVSSEVAMSCHSRLMTSCQVAMPPIARAFGRRRPVGGISVHRPARVQLQPDHPAVRAAPR